MDLKVIRARVIEARLATWAGGANPIITSLGGKRFTYEGDGWCYVDEYKGNSVVFGQETYAEDGQAVWSMVYQGRSENYQPEVSEFLKQILRDHASAVRIGRKGAYQHKEKGHTFFTAPLAQRKVDNEHEDFGNFGSYEHVSAACGATLSITLLGGLLA